MGEIADMMIGGEMCAWCGVWLESQEMGFPVLCHDCHSEQASKCSEPVSGMLCENYFEDNDGTG
jgi:hypothetical protein